MNIRITFIIININSVMLLFIGMPYIYDLGNFTIIIILFLKYCVNLYIVIIFFSYSGSAHGTFLNKVLYNII